MRYALEWREYIATQPFSSTFRHHLGALAPVVP